MGAVDTPERGGKKKKGGLSGRRPKRRVGVRIDMTPMVDVAFLLLIFFMVTTVFRTPKALEINLPPKDATVEVKESMTFTMRILEDGRLYWKRGAATYPWNLMGRYPVVNVPIGRAASGVPVGLQIVANTFDDLIAFQLASAYSTVAPPFFAGASFPDFRDSA